MDRAVSGPTFRERIRLTAFRRDHPGILVAREFGYWQAVIPQHADGERTLAGRGSITGLLDEVEAILADADGDPRAVTPPQ